MGKKCTKMGQRWVKFSLYIFGWKGLKFKGLYTGTGSPLQQLFQLLVYPFFIQWGAGSGSCSAYCREALGGKMGKIGIWVKNG